MVRVRVKVAVSCRGGLEEDASVLLSTSKLPLPLTLTLTLTLTLLVRAPLFSVRI
jgi:hypothetical protein